MMKVFYKVLPLLILFTSLVIFKFGNTQIIINSGPEVSPIDMVECILGDGIQYSNVTYQGADIASGILLNGDSTIIGIDKGVFLTSGAGYNIPGPNNSTSAGFNNGLGGHPLLDAISTHNTYDAAVLEFDFIPENDTLSFEFVFGSEEYEHDYIPSVTDIMGIFITGPDPAGGFYNDLNIALVPDTILPINCHNINNFNNAQYYIDNDNGTTLQYDGFTTVLVAWLLVVPCEEYHVTIGVADEYDNNIDSGVFFNENSFECKIPKIDIEVLLNPPDIGSSMVEGFVDADIVFKLPSPDYSPITINFDVGGTADPSAFNPGPPSGGGDFEEGIPTEITFETGEDSVSMNVNPAFDGIMEGEEYLELIVENTLGCISRYDTVVFPILDYLEMISFTTPNTMICTAQELDLWVQVYNGFPPYTYLWEPGGYTTDSITVNPDTTTTYYITYSDMFTSKMDSIHVTVFPHAEIFSFSFETENNPMLFADVMGEIFEDSISLEVPYGSNLENLVASYELQDSAWIYANNVLQTNGVTENDFSNPVVYEVVTPWGCTNEWVVYVHLVTGQREDAFNKITIFPNPAKEKININAAHGYTVTIFNSLGVELFQEQITISDFAVNVRNFEEGIYFLQFRNETQWIVEKVIINR